MTRVAVLRPEQTNLSIESATIPALGPLDVRIQVLSSGVCGTDLRTLANARDAGGDPIVLGHEVAGLVLEVGREVTRVREGDTVIAAFSSSCGQCWFCVRNETHLCQHHAATRTQRHVILGDGGRASLAAGLGAFADEIAVHQDTVVAVPPVLPAEQLGLIGCSVATGVGAVTRSAKVAPGASVAVFGCGGVGHFVVQGCRLVGAETVIAVDPIPVKRAAALRVGATTAIDPIGADAVEQIHDLTNGRGVDVAFEVAGRSDSFQQAYASTRRGGTVTVVGCPPDGTEFRLEAASIFREAKQIVGSYYGNIRFRQDFPALVALGRAGRIDIGAAVSARFPLERVNDAVDALKSGAVVRAVLAPATPTSISRG